MSDQDRPPGTASVTDTSAAMQDPERRQRQAPGGEKALLGAFLNFQRDTLLWKISGLTDAQLRAPQTPSGQCLLGLVKHLAHVEHNAFQARFAGRELLAPWTDDDPDPDFRIEPDESTASVVAFYCEKVAESRRIIAEVESLEIMGGPPDGAQSLRRALLHMIEETARHVGHADIMRELTDGQTGE
jgi:aspartate aminotransferase-like enzyme